MGPSFVVHLVLKVLGGFGFGRTSTMWRRPRSAILDYNNLEDYPESNINMWIVLELSGSSSRNRAYSSHALQSTPECWNMGTY